VTGAERPAMGSIDSTLYVEAITREAIDITVTGLTTSPGDLASVKADLEAAFAVYLLLLAPFISGITLPQDRNDLITALTLSEIAQGVLAGWGASATQVQFELASGGGFLTSYQLGQGELVKFGTPTYV